MDCKTVSSVKAWEKWDVEAEVVQPAVEVHIVVDGMVVATVAWWERDAESVTALTGVNNPDHVNRYVWILDRSAAALAASEFTDGEGKPPAKDGRGKGEGKGFQDFPF